MIIKLLKKKIINNQTLSKREKRSEFLKLRPKCVNCKRPSKLGTIFTISYYPDNDTEHGYRKFKASCGDLSYPCNLNIEINIGKYESIEQLMNDMRNDINNSKNEIIIDKNNLLFGLVTTETAIENFNKNFRMLQDADKIQSQLSNLGDSLNKETLNEDEIDSNLNQIKNISKNEYLYYRISLNKDNLVEGIASLDKARSLSPTDPKIPYSLIVFYSMLADLEKDPKVKRTDINIMLLELDKMLKLKPDFQEGLDLKEEILKKYQ